MTIPASWQMLLAAFVLDLLAKDPDFNHHPVRWMGRAITCLERSFRKLPFRPDVSGALFAVCLILMAWGLTWASLWFAGVFLLDSVLEVILIYFSVSAGSLEQAAMEVYGLLRQKSRRMQKGNFLIS